MNNYSILSKCFTKTWISNTWKFLWEHNSVLEENYKHRKKLNYSFIMEDFLKGDLKEII